MKKISSLLLVTMLILAGCGGSNSASGNAGTTNINNAATSDTQASTEAVVSTESTEAVSALSGYVFSHNGVDFTVDMEVAAVIDALGEPASYYEVPSCAFEGLEKIYDYTSFEITTYETDDVDYIANIYLKDDLVETPEGRGVVETNDLLRETVQVRLDRDGENGELVKFKAEEVEVLKKKKHHNNNHQTEEEQQD